MLTCDAGLLEGLGCSPGHAAQPSGRSGAPSITHSVRRPGVLCQNSVSLNSIVALGPVAFLRLLASALFSTNARLDPWDAFTPGHARPCPLVPVIYMR